MKSQNHAFDFFTFRSICGEKKEDIGRINQSDMKSMTLQESHGDAPGKEKSMQKVKLKTLFFLKSRGKKH